jgi:hypothetical protein
LKLICFLAGDYVGYMTPATKEKRRDLWKSFNFAGTIDWALDLQAFSVDDMNPNRPASGEGCQAGRDDNVNTESLCSFSCYLGFCPEPLCTCTEWGPLLDLPPEKDGVDVIAWDETNVDLNRLCKFACKYGYCPQETCTTAPRDEPDDESLGYGSRGDFVCGAYGQVCSGGMNQPADIRRKNAQRCNIYKDARMAGASLDQCRNTCAVEGKFEEARNQDRTFSWGCVPPVFPLDQPIPWQHYSPDNYDMIDGGCYCDSWLVNELATSFVEALPAIAQVCFRLKTIQSRSLTNHIRLDVTL